MLDKKTTIQSAGMEDGLIDLVVIQLLVRMCNSKDHSELADDAGQFSKFHSWHWDLEIDVDS